MSADRSVCADCWEPVREVNSRPLLGLPSNVVLLLHGEHLEVQVQSPWHVAPLEVYSGDEGPAAIDAFWHPFARPSVPNLYEIAQQEVND